MCVARATWEWFKRLPKSEANIKHLWREELAVTEASRLEYLRVTHWIIFHHNFRNLLVTFQEETKTHRLVFLIQAFKNLRMCQKAQQTILFCFCPPQNSWTVLCSQTKEVTQVLTLWDLRRTTRTAADHLRLQRGSGQRRSRPWPVLSAEHFYADELAEKTKCFHSVSSLPPPPPPPHCNHTGLCVRRCSEVSTGAR